MYIYIMKDKKSFMQITLGQLIIFSYCIILIILFYTRKITFDLKTICKILCSCCILSIVLYFNRCTFFNSYCGEMNKSTVIFS
jgi:hypothetical protein